MILPAAVANVQPIKIDIGLVVCVLICMAITGVITLIYNSKTPKYNKEDTKRKVITLALSEFFLLATMLLGMPLAEIIKFSLMKDVLLYASLCDIEERKVGDHVSVMLLIIGTYTSLNALLQNAFAGFIVFGFLFICGIIAFKKIGGADIKIIGAATFVLGAEGGLIGLIVGLLSGVILTPIINRKKTGEEKKTMPLVPYLSFGYLSYILVKYAVACLMAK